MDEKLAADLFCSLLMANKIMTGSQIQKNLKENGIQSLTEFHDKREDLLTKEILTSDQMEKWAHFMETPAYQRFDEYVEYVDHKKIRSINRLDEKYPEYMRTLPNMPLILYFKGDPGLLEPGKTRVCIVGTRRPSAYGRRVTRDFSGNLSQHDIVIVSGLARGVDTRAHEACLACGRACPEEDFRIDPKNDRVIRDLMCESGGKPDAQ